MNFFAELSEATKIKVANIEFKNSIEPPYCAYFVENETSIYADSCVVYNRKIVRLELYHTKNDLESEKLIENFLTLKNKTYEKENVWIEKAELVCTIYIMNFERNEEL